MKIILCAKEKQQKQPTETPIETPEEFIQTKCHFNGKTDAIDKPWYSNENLWQREIT